MSRPTEPGAAPILELRNVHKHFPIERGLMRRVHGHVRAVDGVDLTVDRATTVGLVGESGSGKSTLGRLVLRLTEPTSGRVILDGVNITALQRRALRSVRRNLQIVFQDPFSSFDPTSTMLDSIREPMQAHEKLSRAEQAQKAASLLEVVGMSPDYLTRYPSELSGGQLQRAGVARALAVEPKLLVLDEPVSSLDVSTQAQVVNLLGQLQERLHIALLFIAHDLSVVRHVSDRIAVMYLGRIVENGPANDVYTQPKHPYTEALLSAIPIPNPVRQRERRRVPLEGDIPSPADPPPGCRFHTRCPYAMEICRVEDPPAFDAADGTTVFCHLHTTGPMLQGAPVTGVRAQPDGAHGR
jgi:oligopeptide/dipeptide ABC transporter ATP-binding protein